MKMQVQESVIDIEVENNYNRIRTKLEILIITQRMSNI